METHDTSGILHNCPTYCSVGKITNIKANGEGPCFQTSFMKAAKVISFTLPISPLVNFFLLESGILYKYYYCNSH